MKFNSTLIAIAQLAALVAVVNGMIQSESQEDTARIVAEPRQVVEDSNGAGVTPTSHGITSRITKRAACDNARYIDVFFDVGLDGDRFARCTDVPINNWSSSSTPGDFAWCRKELTRCSQANSSHVSGVCVRSSVFCKAAQNYCNTLRGQFHCN